jgi:hypothetical protein
MTASRGRPPDAKGGPPSPAGPPRAAVAISDNGTPRSVERPRDSEPSGGLFAERSVDVDQLPYPDIPEREAAAQPLGTHVRVLPASWDRDGRLLPIDRRIGALLLSYNGQRGIWPSTAELGRQLDVHRRYVRMRLAYLERLGYIERLPVHETPHDPEWTRRGRPSRNPGRQTSNAYLVFAGPGEFRGPLGTGPSDARHPNSGVVPVQPLGTEQRHRQTPVPPLNSEGTTPASKRGRVTQVPRAREVDLLDVGQQSPVSYKEAAEVLAAIEAVFGPIEVLAKWPTGELAPRSVRRWRTKEEAAEERRARAKTAAAQRIKHGRSP